MCACACVYVFGGKDEGGWLRGSVKVVATLTRHNGFVASGGRKERWKRSNVRLPLLGRSARVHLWGKVRDLLQLSIQEGPVSSVFLKHALDFMAEQEKKRL